MLLCLFDYNGVSCPTYITTSLKFRLKLKPVQREQFALNSMHLGVIPLQQENVMLLT